MDYFKDLGSYSKIPLYDFPTLYSALGLQRDSLKKLDINSLDKLVNSDQVTGEHLYLGHLSGFKSLTSLALPAFTLVSRENSKPDSKVTTELSTRTILLPISTSVVAIYLISGDRDTGRDNLQNPRDTYIFIECYAKLGSSGGKAYR